MLYGCGLRRSEVVALDLSDYDAETGALKVRSGKRNKARVSYTAAGMCHMRSRFAEGFGNFNVALSSRSTEQS